MEKEFNLSEKIDSIIKDLEWAIVYDKSIRSEECLRGEIYGLKLALDLFKEFIKRLKEGIHQFNETELGDEGRNQFIDKLAGDKLI